MCRLSWTRDLQKTKKAIGKQDGSTENGILKIMVSISTIAFKNHNNHSIIFMNHCISKDPNVPFLVTENM
jgi:hypothetical protein